MNETIDFHPLGNRLSRESLLWRDQYLRVPLEALSDFVDHERALRREHQRPDKETRERERPLGGQDPGLSLCLIVCGPFIEGAIAIWYRIGKPVLSTEASVVLISHPAKRDLRCLCNSRDI